MELEFEPQLEYSPSVFFVKTLKDSKELCIVCQVDETADGHQWDRYITKCGHISHTRCFRRWCGKKNCLNCPYCGDIPMTQQNAFCSICNKFGYCSLSSQELERHDMVSCMMSSIHKPPNRRTRRSAK